MNIASAVVRQRRWSLVLSYALAVVENTFELLYPLAIGLAVNDLLDDRWLGVVVLSVLSLAHTAVSFGRQRYDARLFARLHADIATQVVHEQREQGADASTIVGRTNLVGEYVDFLERDVALTITALFAVVGSLVMLFVLDPLIGLAAAAVAFPVALLNRRLLRRSAITVREVNDQAEQQAAVVGTGTRDDVRRHFGVLGRRWVRLSDTEAATWSLVEVMGTALAVVALIRTTSAGIEVGLIFATLGYVWAYTGGFDQVPGVLQRLASFGDIRRRLDELDEGATGHV